MLKIQLAEKLTTPDQPEWEMLLNSSFDKTIHPDRKMGFLLSRQALKNAFFEFNIDLPINALRLVNYSTLSGLEKFTISLSHTKNMGAAIVADKSIYLSVGIDIENIKREVKDSIIGLISHPKDHHFKNLEIWCLKESIFKTIMNSQKVEQSIKFSSIEVLENSWGHSPSKLSGTWKIEYHDNYIITTSYLKL